MRKLSKITESLWTDIQSRSAGDTIRREDDINLLDIEDFCDYLKSRYYIDNSVEQRPSKIFIQKFDNGGCFIDVPLFVFNGKNVNNVQDSSSFTYYPNVHEIGFGCTSRKYCRMFLELLSERFAIKGSGIRYDMNTQYFKGNITNKTLIEMIDFVIDNIKKPLIPIIVKK